MFLCFLVVTAAVHVPGKPTRTKKGTRPGIKRLPAQKVSFGSKSLATPIGAMYMSSARAPRLSSLGRIRKPAGAASGGNQMQMRMLLPLLLRGEAEGLVQILLLANLVKGRSTSPQIKFLMLSGRLGKNVYIIIIMTLRRHAIKSIND